jgi:ADP-ribosyl-[dinitrogen reductase] hydrolase
MNRKKPFQGCRMTPLDACLARLPSDLTPLPLPVRDRFEALLYGLAIGDALGNTTESRRPRHRLRYFGEITGYLPNRHANDLPVGVPSDDTQMAFWLLEHLLERGRLVPEALAELFATREIYGMGQSVGEFRVNLRSGLPWDRAGSRSAGNGAIMRIAPMLLLQSRLTPSAFAAEVMRCAAITHNQAGAIASAYAWVALLAEFASGSAGPTDALDRFLPALEALEGDAFYRPRGGALIDQFYGPLSAFLRRTVPDGLERGLDPLAFGDLTHSGAYLLETLPTVLFLLMRTPDDPDRAIRDAVNLTRDNDTIASLVATAMGAAYGMDAFRPGWLSGLLGRTGASDDGAVQGLIREAISGECKV